MNFWLSQFPPHTKKSRLGKSNVLLEPLSEYLGDDFVLESALVITVDGGTEGQNAHTDTDARQERNWRSGVEVVDELVALFKEGI